MSAPDGSAAPASGTHDSDIPTFEELAADPEIAPLLEFEPAPRKIERPDGWTAELQRELIARIAHTGSPGAAVDQMDKNLSGAKHLYRTDGADSFRAAWKAAIALGAGRKRAERAAALAGRPAAVPGIERSRRAQAAEPLPGQVLNEFGEWEDEESIHQRAEEARDSISNKLLRARRLYLAEISGSAGKRAAFEILTELPIDWERAERLEPQPDEPWRRVSMRAPDMLLTAENGWLGAELVHGPDKKAELRRAIDEHRASEGLEPVGWDADD
jgi:hypothetical protein